MLKTRIALITFLAFFVAAAGAQSDEKEPVAIVELGAATSWSIRGGAATFAPDFAVETTPIENWLEIEFGTYAVLYPQFDRVGH